MSEETLKRDANVVGLLMRGDECNVETGEPLDKVAFSLLIAKNRNGPVGEIKLAFFPKCTRFEDDTPS